MVAPPYRDSPIPESLLAPLGVLSFGSAGPAAAHWSVWSAVPPVLSRGRHQQICGAICALPGTARSHVGVGVPPEVGNGAPDPRPSPRVVSMRGLVCGLPCGPDDHSRRCPRFFLPKRAPARVHCARRLETFSGTISARKVNTWGSDGSTITRTQ
jgi:hypothetical protein